MTITINEQKRNELLKREEIKGFSPSFKTPNFDEIRTELASLVKKPAENVFVKKIMGKYGTNNFGVEAYIYDSKEIAEKVEPKQKKSKKVQEVQANG